jgi:hypothetical protein
VKVVVPVVIVRVAMPLELGTTVSVVYDVLTAVIVTGGAAAGVIVWTTVLVPIVTVVAAGVCGYV